MPRHMAGRPLWHRFAEKDMSKLSLLFLGVLARSVVLLKLRCGSLLCSGCIEVLWMVLAVVSREHSRC
jgi:hypothetical protein